MSTGLPQHFHRSSRRRRCSFKTQPKLIFFMTPPSIKNNPVSSSPRMGEKSPEPSAPPPAPRCCQAGRAARVETEDANRSGAVCTAHSIPACLLLLEEFTRSHLLTEQNAKRGGQEIKTREKLSVTNRQHTGLSSPPSSSQRWL